MDTGGSLQALFAVSALIVGLCSHRFVTAFKWGIVLGLACLMLFVIVALAVRFQSEHPGMLAGYVAGTSSAVVLAAMFGYAVRWTVAALARRLRRAE